MRPYKKRSFHSQLQSSENNMDAENSEDSEKQVSSSPPIEDIEKDKEGETKRRKKWKRKISRKQFRHHDIKLFTPGEYKSTSLLKQKDSTPPIPKKPDTASKESITESIVTSLSGQKQKKGEDIADSTTKNDVEENNNTNGIQNNNNIGKHNLPAIIMETPSIRRRSVDNTNMPKTNFKSIDSKFDRRTSVDMPLLYPSEQIKKIPDMQPEITNSRLEENNFRNIESKINANEYGKNVNRTDFKASDTYTIEHEIIHHFNHKHGPNQTQIEQNYLMINERNNDQVEGHHRIQRLQDRPMPMETSTSTDEQPIEPENLSLKRRLSEEIPVDLSKKGSHQNEDRGSNRRYQNPQQNGDSQRMILETKLQSENSHSSLKYQLQTNSSSAPVLKNSSRNTYTGEYGRNNVPHHNSTSPKALHSNIPYLDKTESKRHPRALQETVGKITNLNMWQEVLNRLLQQPFSLQILDLLAHAYAQVDQARNENSIPPELRIKAQKMLSEAFNFISGKLKQLSLDVDPVIVVKILGKAENSMEKITLKNYIENIDSIRKLAIEDAGAGVLKMPPSQFSHFSNFMQNYKKQATPSPSPYSSHINQPQCRRNSRDNDHLPGEPSSRISNHPSPIEPLSPIDHQIGQSFRAGGQNMLLGHLRGSSPKTGNHPVSGGYSRETSPRIGDHPMPMEIPSRNGDYSISQRWPSPRTNEHPVGSRLSQRIGEYAFPPGHPRGPSPKTAGHQMPTEIPLRTGDYPIRQKRSREPSPQATDHPVLSGRSQNIGEYNFSQGHSRNPSPNIDVHSTPYGHRTVSETRPVEYPVLQRNSRETSPRTGDHPLLLKHPGAFLRPGGELMQQIVQLPPPRSDMPLDRTSELSVRAGNQFIGPGFIDRPTTRSGEHSVPLGYLSDLQFQHSYPYNMPYLSNNLNPNPFLAQASHKEPTTRSSGLVGRPRSKSHRTADIKNGLQQLRRSLSNPQRVQIEHPLLDHSYLEGVSNMMPPPRVPMSFHNFLHSLHPNNNLPHQMPNVGQNKEPSAAPTLKPTTPALYSEDFYQKLKNHMTTENPLSITMHPQLTKKVSNLNPKHHGLDIIQTQKGTQNMNKAHQKAVRNMETLPLKKKFFSLQASNDHHAHREPLIRSPTEDKISSSTDHIEISKVTNVPQQSGYEKGQSSVSPKPPETIKSIPVAVIVADNSMQITKEKKSDQGSINDTSQDVTEIIDESRISVSSNSNDNISSSEENLRQAFDREQEENNTEFLVWLEKLKSNEKLKSRFLSQMGIIKKEEPAFTPGGDPIEIVDSDEEDPSSKPKTEKREAQKRSQSLSETLTINSPKESSIIESIKNYVPHKPPTNAPISPATLEMDKVLTESKLSAVTNNSTAKQSLSKKGYMPPIPLPYVPTSTEQSLNKSPSKIEKSKKGVYSPQIEPISPVSNEATFVFPDVANGPKLLPSDRTSAFSENITSPTYHKRKNPLSFPNYQKGENGSPKTDYPSNDNSVKRRKSLDRPELARSPRVAPIGKLCYVRENHMFFRYFDDTQAELFIRNLSTQDDELVRSTGIEPEQFKNAHKTSNFGLNQPGKKTEVIYFPEYVEFSEKEDIPDVEEFIKETSLVEQFVPKDFADFYRYVTGFQIIKNKHPVSLQTFLTMYNTNRTSELLRKYLERDEVVSRKR